VMSALAKYNGEPGPSSKPNSNSLFTRARGPK
jgi:hypothetical protein